MKLATGAWSNKYTLTLRNHTDLAISVLVDEDPEGSLDRFVAKATMMGHGGSLKVATPKTCECRPLQELVLNSRCEEKIHTNCETPLITAGLWVPDRNQYALLWVNRAFNHMEDVDIQPGILLHPVGYQTSMESAWREAQRASRSSSGSCSPGSGSHLAEHQESFNCEAGFKTEPEGITTPTCSLLSFC